MDFHHPQFREWHEAERSAREAKQALYSKLCDGNTLDQVTQGELDRARALRRNATALMSQLLSDVRKAAESLRFGLAKQPRWQK